MSIRLIVGLGNPGKNYQKTRHNAGFWFLQLLSEQFSLVQNFVLSKKFDSLVAQIKIEDEDFFLLQPMTYMNESGRAIAKFIKFYKIQSEKVLIAHDELDFPAGKICLKFDGGHGGHNGLRNIIQHIGADFWRLRIGIGRPIHNDLVHDYVLHQPTTHEKKEIEESMHRLIPLIPELVKGNFEQVMCELHTQPT